MDDGQKFERKMEMEYSSNSSNLQMNTANVSEKFNTEVKKLELNPNIVDIRSMKIDRKGVIVNFSSMMVCETDGEEFTTKMYGVTMDGENPESVFKKIPSFKSHIFGEKWEKSVEKQKERMEKRRNKISDLID